MNHFLWLILTVLVAVIAYRMGYSDGSLNQRLDCSLESLKETIDRAKGQL